MTNYRLDHVEGVVDLAKEIASGTEANMEVVVLAAWLHDLAKPGSGGISQHHGIVSADLAEEILTTERVSPEVINQVSDVIRKHVGLTIKEPLRPIEAQILWEADKILKLGIVGFIQYLLNGLKLHPGRSLGQIADSLREFLSLASRIAACMETARAKELAKERLETLRVMSEFLDSELVTGK